MARWNIPGAALALALAPAATAELIIDTISSWDDRISFGWNAVAQTLVVPGDKPTLSTFELGVMTNNPGATFRIRLYEWDRSVEHVIGSELFATDSIVAPSSLEFMEIVMDVDLVGGFEYAVIFDWDSTARGGVAYIQDLNPYEEGYATFTSGPLNSPWPFGQESGFDMAFRAVFVPAPAGIAVLLTTGLVRRRRRRGLK